MDKVDTLSRKGKVHRLGETINVLHLNHDSGRKSDDDDDDDDDYD